jgi:hypothetical protein
MKGRSNVRSLKKQGLKINLKRCCIELHKTISYSALGVIQKIRVKIGGREGSCHLTQNVTVGEGGVRQFNT